MSGPFALSSESSLPEPERDDDRDAGERDREPEDRVAE